MIDAYNAGSLNAEEFFQQLVAFAQSLNAEEQRGVGEQLSEEELALFDLLTKPHIDMSDADRVKGQGHCPQSCWPLSKKANWCWTGANASRPAPKCG
jgi:hypothetical protein